MNQAASHVTNRRGSQELYEVEGFSKQKWRGAGTRTLLATEEKGLFQARLPFLRGNGKKSVIQMTSLMLIGKFQIDWLKILHLEEAEIAVSLGIKS